MAILMLNSSKKENIESRCVVYGKDMQRSSALLLASQHNEYNQVQFVTTFPEIPASCRCLIFLAVWVW